MVRTKAVALLLGPSGVGLVGLYISATELVGTIAGLGIGQSGVREVAEAHGSGNAERIARTVKTLRRASWATGILGWLLTAVFSYPLSFWVFGSGERAWAIALLGASLLLSAINAGQLALIQGTRRIGDLARLNVLGAIASTITAIGLYGWLGEKGIVPVLLATAVLNLGGSCWFARRIQIVEIPQTWTESLVQSRRLVSLGLAFMCSALAGSAVGLGIRILIVRDLGIDANGIYQAAWAISGMFGNFIVAAMGTDFYPRLSATINDAPAATRLVNEQTEVGVLMALPGLLGTMLYAPWMLHALFSAKFVSGDELLPWLILSVFLRMVSYPMGYILLAKGTSGRYFLITTAFHVLDLTFCSILIPVIGLPGIAIGNAFLCVVYPIAMRILVGPLINFKWSKESKCLIAISGALILAALFCRTQLPAGWAEIAGIPLLIGASVFSLRGVATRLGRAHRFVALLLHHVPGGRFVCGL